jgi:hypothetical protein
LVHRTRPSLSFEVVAAEAGRMLRSPAQYGREVVRRIALRSLAGLAAIAVVTAGLGLLLGISSPGFIAAEIVALGLMAIGDRVITPRLDRRIQGNEGELQVGAILDGLADQGWLTLHDVSLGRGNIDHLVVGPGGVVTVETKSHGGRIAVARLDPRWLKQAYAQRKLVERITGERVDCLLVFSRAYLDRAISRQRGVLVLPSRMLAGHLARREARLTPPEIQALHARLAAALS